MTDKSTSPEPKTKLVARISPSLPSFTVDAEGPYNGSQLGKLLLKKFCNNTPLDEFSLTHKHLDYIRGLADAGVMDAARLLKDLVAVGEYGAVNISFDRVPE